MGWYVSTAPTSEPISRAEAKLDHRITSDAEDLVLDQMIQAARELLERTLNRALVNQTHKLTLDDWPTENNRIYLPRPPLSSVSSITYLDSNGASQTLSSSVYQVVTSEEPGFVRLAYGQNWPTCRQITDSITVTYVAGYGATGDHVPAGIRMALQILVGDLYEHRESKSDRAISNIDHLDRYLWAWKVPYEETL